jgi:hypothetical protein
MAAQPGLDISMEQRWITTKLHASGRLRIILVRLGKEPMGQYILRSAHPPFPERELCFQKGKASPRAIHPIDPLLPFRSSPLARRRRATSCHHASSEEETRLAPLALPQLCGPPVPSR